MLDPSTRCRCDFSWSFLWFKNDQSGGKSELTMSLHWKEHLKSRGAWCEISPDFCPGIATGRYEPENNAEAVVAVSGAETFVKVDASAVCVPRQQVESFPTLSLPQQPSCVDLQTKPLESCPSAMQT